jgi:ribosomal protein S18 acetylase RimI-like enzyme
MFVRTAGERDLDEVRALLVETWHATYDAIHGAAKVTELLDEWHSVASLRRRLAQPNSDFLVADDGKRLGGMAYAAAKAGGKTVMLHQLYVRPDLQGRGIGGMLLDEIVESFPDAELFRLEVDVANTKATGFYLSQGFSQVGRTENCSADGSGLPALIFERTASGSGSSARRPVE